MNQNRNYFHQIGISIDQLLNAILAGYADETLSSRAYRCRNSKKRWMVIKKVIDFIFFWEKDHCKQSYINEVFNYHLPVHFRNLDNINSDYIPGKHLKGNLMFFKYIFYAITLFLGKAIVMIFAPIMALPPFVRMREERATTGYPSQFPGMERAFLVKWLMWAQTHDDCLDAFWYAKRFGRWIDRYDQKYFDNHWWLRYYCYVAWLWRNAAYGLAHNLGFSNEEIVTIKTKGSFLWRKGINYYSYEVVKNNRGEKAFEFMAQWYYSKKVFFEARLGWGVRRKSPKNLGMLYIRILPFKKRDI